MELKQGGVRPLLVDSYERVTDQLLTSAATANGDRVQAKVRLADAIHIGHLRGRVKQFALMAHLDFVIVDSVTSLPRFAVEFDGASHWEDPATRQRDRMKDALCEAARLPLLRISSEYTQRRGRWIVLSYAIDAFYLSEAFFRAQEQGQIPWDEPFDQGSFVVKDESGHLLFNTLDAPTRLRMLRHYEERRLPAWTPDIYVTRVGELGAVQAHAFLGLAPDRYLLGRVRLRNCLFQGTSPSEIADQLAMLEIGDLADRWLSGEPVACNGKTLARALDEVQQAIDAGGFLHCATGGAFSATGSPPRRVKVKLRSQVLEKGQPRPPTGSAPSYGASYID